MALAITIGSVTLSSFEVPERLEDLAGVQAVAVHDFPGGIRTLQTYGAFPSRLRWHGLMTGTFALPRVAALDQIRTSGQMVTLSYGPKAFLGILARFKVRARTQWFVEYEAEFWPAQDTSAGLTPNAASYSQMLNSQSLWLQQAYDGITGFGIPASLLVPTGTLIQSLQLFLGSTVASTAGPNLLAAAGSVQKTAAPLMQSTTSSVASPASDLYARAGVIQVLAVSNGRTGWVVETINPNLLRLAAQYYGDSSKWQTIAAANGLVDPQPIGAYTLQVPASP